MKKNLVCLHAKAMKTPDSWDAHAQTWKSLPRRSSVIFFAGVFCLFGSLVLIGTSLNFRSQSPLEMVGVVVISGGFAILWAYAGTRKKRWMFGILFPLQFGANFLLGLMIAPRHSLAAVEEIKAKFLLNGVVEMLLIVAGYALFIYFFNIEGARFFRTQTEIKLAGEVHRALVPDRHEKIGAIEIFGSSIPSGEVGGDLFDIIVSDGRWHAYVADVSGHGVPAGILMSMIKSTASMQLTKMQKPAELLNDLNDVLQPFTSPANYLTFAYVGGGKDEDEAMSFALAGHLPILHYQSAKKAMVEHSDGNVPIGMFKGQAFSVSRLVLESGDLLAIITDGFTEVADAKGREIGLEDFKRMLLACAERPLPEIYKELRERTIQYGKQNDDQTMLLIRRRV